MLRRFASLCLSVLMLAALTSQTWSPVIAAGPAAADPVASNVQPIEAAAVETASAVAGTPALVVLSDLGGDDRYTFILDSGNDLRVDGDIMVNHDAWYGGVQAVVRCGSSPCTPPTCNDWNPLPTDHQVLMCGHALYVDHSNGSTPTILSARTISLTGGWQARNDTDIVHADQPATCFFHPKFLGYPPALQETNVCIGVTQIADPLNDPADSGNIVPPPDPFALSSCPGAAFPCGPVASETCVAEPGSELRLPTGTFTSPAKLFLVGGANQKKLTICPGLYFGGFGTNGDGNAQPHVIMLPGIYYMVGGGFSVNGSASITSVSSQGDGVMIYNSGADESFSESFPSDSTLIPTICPPPTGSACNATGTPVLNPPSAGAIGAGTPVTYKLTVPKGAFVGAPVPTGTPSSFTFYDGTTPIACEAPGLQVTTLPSSLVATCTTRYTTFGQKGITAVYAGDAMYAPTGAMKNQAVISSPSATQDNIDLRTSNGPCAALWNPVTDPCGQIVLHAPTSGQYSGLLLFQDRATGFLQGALAMLIQPYLGAPACDTTTVGTPLGDQPAFMAYGVAPDTHAIPDPCGPLGGLSGTIYAPHLASGSPADWDAVVHIMASGLANLKVIAAEVDLTQPGLQVRLSPPNLTDLSPAKVWIGLKNSDDVGTNFDLLAEVFENNVPIGSGEVDNVPGGGSGFNRAVNRCIALALAAPRTYGPTNKLSIKLSVRVGATGHRSGTARLWYNDAGANSLFDATINGIETNFYLRDGFVLGNSPAPVTSTSKKTIDVFVDRLVGSNPWKPFGTWTQ